MPVEESKQNDAMLSSKDNNKSDFKHYFIRTQIAPIVYFAEYFGTLCIYFEVHILQSIITKKDELPSHRK